MSQTKAKDKDQFVVRFPDGMRDKIAEAAKDNNRSMNAEIVARLEDSFMSSAASRYRWALAQINDASSVQTTVSMLAEAISEQTAELLERVFSGTVFPAFELSDRAARYLGVRPAWLKHGEGRPYEVGSISSYGAKLADELVREKPKKIVFLRSMSREGNVAIVVHRHDFVCEVFTTTLNLSDQIGGHGEYDLASFSNTCRKLRLHYQDVASVGLLLESEHFIQLIHGQLYPLLAVKLARPSNWLSDWWDPSSFERQTTDLDYWDGYRELCKRVYDVTDIVSSLQVERDEIMGSNIPI